MTTIKTKLSTGFVAAAAAALLLPALASAQPPVPGADADYCSALVKKYETYLDTGSKRGLPPQGLESREAASRCQAGDPAGIAALEKALNNARIPLPARG